jgi:short-subunit dehydrogenase
MSAGRPAASHPIRGRRYWVVGASSGIGAALAQELVRRGADVAISARRADELTKVGGGRMVTVPLDATDPEAVVRAAKDVREALGGLDAVVWSAGFWRRFDAQAWDGEVFAQHVQVNLLGLNNVLAAVLPEMVRTRRGHVVGIASVAGYRGLAGAEAYGSTKAAQIYLLEAMRASLSHKGVRVTTVSPGFVRTEMTENNSFPMPFLIDPEQAATSIADGIEGSKQEIIFPLPMTIIMKTANVLPVRLWSALTARMGKKSA